MSNPISKTSTRKKPPAKPSKVRVAIILDAGELEQLNMLADSTRRNRSQMVGWLVREAVRVVGEHKTS